jgi:molybdate transport system regulatory protein
MELKAKIWITDDQGNGVMGDGRYRLLKEIDAEHSLQKAAQNLGISYRKAWGDIRQAEQRLGFKLLTKQRGGSGGGASTLTDRAAKLLHAYDKTKSHIQSVIRKQYQQNLQDILNEKVVKNER